MTKPIPYPLRGEWLITEQGGDLVRGVWETAQATGKAERIALALEARNGEPFKNERRCVVSDGIAVMEIDGPLMRKAELFSDISGATSYQWIGATADALRADPAVEKVIIRASSPGGEAAGCGECGEKIARLAAEKHVEAYVETEAASAMYWLLSQCTHITAHATAQVGWIGAIRDLFDNSKRDESNGVKRRQLVSKGAENKRSFPIEKPVVDRAQRSVDEWGKLFTAAVAAGRGVSEATVLEDFGGGDGMFAEQALAVGLIDEIGDFESVLARLSGLTSAGATYATRPNRGATTMTMNGVRASDADNEWKCTGCKEMMGPSATKYCAKCATPAPDSDGDDDGDEDEDEDEAKALRMDAKATAGARRVRMAALADFEKQVLEDTKAPNTAAALRIIGESMAAAQEVTSVRASARKTELRATLERGISGEPGKAPRLSLGLIQKTLPTVLRGAPKKAWVTAMDKLAADADAAKATVTSKQVIDAACSVDLSAEDLEAIADYAEKSPPVAASTFIEPARNGEDESLDIDATAQQIKAYAERADKVLNRGKVAADAKK